MKIKTIAAILIIWSISSFNAQACPPGEISVVDYIRRDNNRCEGIKQRTDISGSLRLVSLTTRNIKNLNDSLTLKIPRLTNNLVPEVVVRAINYRYQLDKLTLIPQSTAYNFTWSTYVLKKAEIPIKSLRATAILGSQSVYIPVVIGQPTNHYEFVFFTNRPARFLNLEIRRNGKAVYKTSRLSYRRGEIIFTWDGRKAEAGRYELYYKAELEQVGRPPEVIPRIIYFEHNPSWLR